MVSPLRYRGHFQGRSMFGKDKYIPVPTYSNLFIYRGKVYNIYKFPYLERINLDKDLCGKEISSSVEVVMEGKKLPPKYDKQHKEFLSRNMAVLRSNIEDCPDVKISFEQ